VTIATIKVLLYEATLRLEHEWRSLNFLKGGDSRVEGFGADV
jgi:hypothetical protein